MWCILAYETPVPGKRTFLTFSDRFKPVQSYAKTTVNIYYVIWIRNWWKHCFKTYIEFTLLQLKSSSDHSMRECQICHLNHKNHSSLSDKIPLISCPIKTGRGVMSLLTPIPAAKPGCQQIASISQTILVVSEAFIFMVKNMLWSKHGRKTIKYK